MPGLADLNAVDRTCDSRQVRLACALERAHGYPDLDDRTWWQYRRLCKVPRSTKKLTQQEVILLLVCASMHRAGRTNLTYLQIVVEAEQRATTPQAIATIDRFCGEGATITGREVLEYLKLLGRPRSDKTLYRWGQQKGMPRFGLNRKYTPWQVRRWLEAV